MAEHFRKHGLLARLAEAGFAVEDLGKVDIPDSPRHNIPPVRNYPLPALVWRNTAVFVERHITDRDDALIICLGGDCSMAAGTVSGLMRVFPKDKLRLICLDGDVDSTVPDPEKCAGSAGMGLWFLTQKSDLWDSPGLPPSQIVVAGNKQPPDTNLGIPLFPLKELRETGIKTAAARILAGMPVDAHLAVHFDVDILAMSDMPAAYAPREQGLTAAETEELLGAVLADGRTRYLELSEFMPQKDPDGRFAKILTGMLVRSLKR